MITDDEFAAFARRRQGIRWGFERCVTRPKVLGQQLDLLVRYFERVLEMMGRGDPIIEIQAA